jgi:hypothetical protein
MAKNKVLVGLGALVMAATVAACNADRAPAAPGADADAQLARTTATPPAAAPSTARGVLPQPIGEATSILRDEPLAADITVSEVIGPLGGHLEIPEAGLRVEVPRGAVSEPTTFTATALAGDMVAYEFGPHGTNFPVPLLVLQSTPGTNLARLPNFTVVQAGYFTGPEMLDRTTKRARVAEVLPTFGLTFGDQVGFLVRHFSGYIIQVGFKRSWSN